MSKMLFLLLQVFIWFGADATDIEKKLSVKATQVHVCLSPSCVPNSTSKEREGEELSVVFYLIFPGVHKVSC